MITKEQIKQAAIARGFKLNNDAGDDLKPYVYEFARDIIALAQEVRPLVWVSCGSDEIHALKNNFKIRKFKDRFSLYYRTTLFGRYPTIDEAKSAAQADFNRRVLENLVHGESK